MTAIAAMAPVEMLLPTLSEDAVPDELENEGDAVDEEVEEVEPRIVPVPVSVATDERSELFQLICIIGAKRLIVPAVDVDVDSTVVEELATSLAAVAAYGIVGSPTTRSDELYTPILTKVEVANLKQVWPDADTLLVQAYPLDRLVSILS